MRFIKGHWQLIALVGLVILFWQTPFVLPLKILVVFLHELSHALAAVLTGGAVEGMSLSAQQGGHAITRGGNGFVILSAGYVGSLVFGLFVLLIALRTNADRIVLAIFGAVMIAVAAIFMRDAFAFTFCLGGGMAMCAIARFLPRSINDMMLRVIGLTSLLYVPLDIVDDTIKRPNLRSDAYMLAEQFGGSAQLWGGFWLLLSVSAILFCIRFGLGKNSNLTLR